MPMFRGNFYPSSDASSEEGETRACFRGDNVAAFVGAETVGYDKRSLTRRAVAAV
jgi:hypothetical protein